MIRWIKNWDWLLVFVITAIVVGLAIAIFGGE